MKHAEGLLGHQAAMKALAGDFLVLLLILLLILAWPFFARWEAQHERQNEAAPITSEYPALDYDGEPIRRPLGLTGGEW